MTTSRSPLSGYAASQAPTLSPTAAGGPPPAVDDSLLWATPYVVSSDPDAPYQPGDVQMALDDIAASGDDRAVLLVEPGSYSGDYTYAPTGIANLTVQAIAGDASAQGLVEFSGTFTVTSGGAGSGGAAVFVGVRFLNPGSVALQSTLGVGGPNATPQVFLRECAVDGTLAQEETTVVQATDCDLSGFAAPCVTADGAITTVRCCTLTNSDGAVSAVSLVGTAPSLCRLIDSTVVAAPSGAAPVIASSATSGVLELRGRRASSTCVVNDRTVVQTTGESQLFVTGGARLQNSGASPTVDHGAVSTSAAIVSAEVVNESLSGSAVVFSTGGPSLTIENSRVEGGAENPDNAAVRTVEAASRSTLITSGIATSEGRYGFTYRRAEWSVGTETSTAPATKYVVDRYNAEASFQTVQSALNAITADAALPGAPTRYVVELAAGEYPEAAITYTVPQGLTLVVRSGGAPAAQGIPGEASGAVGVARISNLVTFAGDSALAFTSQVLFEGVTFEGGIDIAGTASGGAPNVTFRNSGATGPASVVDPSAFNISEIHTEGANFSDGLFVSGYRGLRFLDTAFLTGGTATAALEVAQSSGGLYSLAAIDCAFRVGANEVGFLSNASTAGGDFVRFVGCRFSTGAPEANARGIQMVSGATFDPANFTSLLLFQCVFQFPGSGCVAVEYDATPSNSVSGSMQQTSIDIGPGGSGIVLDGFTVAMLLSNVRISAQGDTTCLACRGDSQLVTVDDSVLTSGEDGFAVTIDGTGTSEISGVDSSFSADSTGSPVGGVIDVINGGLNLQLKGGRPDSFSAEGTVSAGGDRAAINSPGPVELVDAAILATGTSSVPAVICGAASLTNCDLEAGFTCLQATGDITARNSNFSNTAGGDTIETSQNARLSQCTVANQSATGRCVNASGALLLRNCYAETFGDGVPCVESGASMTVRHSTVFGATANGQAAVCAGSLVAQNSDFVAVGPLACVEAGSDIEIVNSVVRNFSVPPGPPAISATGTGVRVELRNCEVTGGDGSSAPGSAPTIASVGGAGNLLVWGQITSANNAAAAGFTYVGADFIVANVEQTATGV